MAWIQERKGDKARAPWRVKWVDDTGRERSRSFVDKAAAKAFKRSVETDLANGNWIDPNLGAITLAEWVPIAVESWSDLRPSSLDRAGEIIRNQILPRFSTTSIDRITPDLVQSWINDLTKKGLAPATVRKAYHVLARLMTDAVEPGRRIPASPCVGIRLPKVERHEARFLTPSEVARLADVGGPDWRAFVMLSATAGLRIGETLALKWSDVDLRKGTVHVRTTVTESGGRTRYGAPKTARSVRTVPLPRVAREALRAHLEAQGVTGRDAFVFSTVSGRGHRPNNFRSRIWQPNVVDAGLGTFTKTTTGGRTRTHFDGLVVHELRHTAVALWIEAGASANEVAQRAGHTSTSVVLDRYGHRFPMQAERVNDALDALFGDDEAVAVKFA